MEPPLPDKQNCQSLQNVAAEIFIAEKENDSYESQVFEFYTAENSNACDIQKITRMKFARWK